MAFQQIGRAATSRRAPPRQSRCARRGRHGFPHHRLGPATIDLRRVVQTSADIQQKRAAAAAASAVWNAACAVAHSSLISPALSGRCCGVLPSAYKAATTDGLPAQASPLDRPGQRQVLHLNPDIGQINQSLAVQRCHREAELGFGTHQALFSQTGQRLTDHRQAHPEPLAERVTSAAPQAQASSPGCPAGSARRHRAPGSRSSSRSARSRTTSYRMIDVRAQDGTECLISIPLASTWAVGRRNSPCRSAGRSRRSPNPSPPNTACRSRPRRGTHSPVPVRGGRLWGSNPFVRANGEQAARRPADERPNPRGRW